MTETEDRAQNAPICAGIDIERYAEVMAHVRHFGKTNTPEVLKRMELDEDRWEEALFGFTALLVEESEREEEALSRRFGECFAKTKTRLGQEKPAITSIGLRVEEKKPEASDKPTVVTPLPPVTVSPPAPTVVAPVLSLSQSQLQQTPAPTHQGISPWARSSHTVPIVQPILPPIAAPPIVPPAAVVVPNIVPPVVNKPDLRDSSILPAGMRNFTSIHGTQGPVLDASTKAALPFAKDATVAEPDAAFHRAKDQVEVPSKTDLGRSKPAYPGAIINEETRDISTIVGVVLAQKKSTPFERDVPASKTVPAPVPVPAVVAPVAAVVAPIVAPVAAVVAPGPTPGASEAPNPKAITITLEQYASLCAEIAQSPSMQHEITQRYALSEENASRVDAYWRARIASEPDVDQAFRWAYHSYQQWLARR